MNSVFRGALSQNIRHFSVSKEIAINACLNNPLYSGHNKWSTIKHDKAKNDAERNKLFTKYANQISLAVKLSGGNTDPNLNIRLGTAIEAATKNNVTKKVIENAIKKGSGTSLGSGKAGMETCVYEGMGPGGVAFVVEALTDNKNRTVGLVRSSFTKAAGSMSPTLFFFEKKGYVVVNSPAKYATEDEILERVLEIEGVEDLEALEDTDLGPNTFEISTEPSSTNNVALVLKEEGFEIQDVGIGYVAKSDMLVHTSDADTKEKLLKFVNVLDSIEDVTAIHTNSASPIE